MPTEHAELLAKLTAPFDPKEVKSKPNSTGRTMLSTSARPIMNRLDQVMGPENWRDEYRQVHDGVSCRLSLRLGGEWVYKEDVGGYPGMVKDKQGTPDTENDIKAAWSDAFKRAAAKWGIGRYLYPDSTYDPYSDEDPGEARQEAEQTCIQATGNCSSSNTGVSRQRPRSGKALFAWIKDQEQQWELPLLKYMNSWGKLQEFPQRIVDWEEGQVAAGYEEAVKKLRSILPNYQDRNQETSGSGQQAQPQKQFHQAEDEDIYLSLASPTFRDPAAVFAWANDLQRVFQVSIVKAWSPVAKQWGLPWRMDQLDDEGRKRFVAWALATVRESPTYKGELEQAFRQAPAYPDDPRLKALRHKVYDECAKLTKALSGQEKVGPAQVQAMLDRLLRSHPAGPQSMPSLNACTDVGLMEYLVEQARYEFNKKHALEGLPL